MKRTAEINTDLITSEEFKELVNPQRKKKRANIRQVFEKTEFLAENFNNDNPRERSLFDEMDEHIIGSDYDRIIAKTENEYLAADLLGQATPGDEFPRSIYDLGHVYTKTLLMAIPCSQELKTKINAIEVKIDALTVERRRILKSIKKDLGPLIHKEAEDFMRKYIITSDQAAGETE